MRRHHAGKQSTGSVETALFFGFYEFDHFPLVGKAAHVLLGENQLPAILNLENSSTRLHQFRLNAEFRLQFLRQTGGFGPVVSRSAKGNLATFSHDRYLPYVRRFLGGV
jgi:hypothetical protein